LIGSVYFIGVVCTVMIYPIISDRCAGRKYVFLISGVIFAIAFFGLILATDLIWCYVFMFIMGTCWGGRIIVGMNYVLELNNPEYSKTLVFLFLITEPIILILLTFWYQFIDNSWKLISIITLCLIIVTLLTYWLFVPESAKWLYTWKHFDEARQVIREISSFNGVEPQ